MAVGSDKVVDMGFIEAGLDERSAPSAAGSNSRHASANTGFTKRQKALTRARAKMAETAVATALWAVSPGIVTF